MRKIIVAALLAFALPQARQPVTLTVRVEQPGAKIDPIFYGLMTEEINFSYEGGLYAESIRNRTFKAHAQNPMFWNAIGHTTIALDTNQPLRQTVWFFHKPAVR